jgi:hemolysin III
MPPRLYDLRRDRYYVKPVWRGWLHLVWFEATLVLGTLLIVAADGAREITAASIYAGSVVGLFGTSALYHRGNWSPAWSRRLQRLDYSMIYVLIGGTAAPALIVSGPSRVAMVLLVVLAVAVGAAITLRLAHPRTLETVAGTSYLVLGWAAGAALPFAWTRGGVAVTALLVCGGLLYTAGAITFHRRRPDPLPSVFGYHEVFHSYVCAAASCHFVAIVLLLT